MSRHHKVAIHRDVPARIGYLAGRAVGAAIEAGTLLWALFGPEPIMSVDGKPLNVSTRPRPQLEE